MGRVGKVVPMLCRHRLREGMDERCKATSHLVAGGAKLGVFHLNALLRVLLRLHLIDVIDEQPLQPARCKEGGRGGGGASARQNGVLTWGGWQSLGWSQLQTSAGSRPKLPSLLVASPAVRCPTHTRYSRLVGQVDAELREGVRLEVLKTEDVENPNRRERLLVLGPRAVVEHRHAPANKTNGGYLQSCGYISRHGGYLVGTWRSVQQYV